MARKPDLSSYEKYIKGGSWKCPKAPINPDLLLHVANNCGGHWWILKDNNIWVCKYCGDAQKRPMTFAQAMAEQHPGGAYPLGLMHNELGLADRDKVPMKKHWGTKW